MCFIRHNQSTSVANLPSFNWLMAFFITQKNSSPSISVSCKKEQQYLYTSQGYCKDSLIRYRFVFKWGDSTTAQSLHSLCSSRVRAQASCFLGGSFLSFGEMITRDFESLLSCTACHISGELLDYLAIA